MKVFMIFSIFVPYFLSNVNSPSQMFLLQSVVAVFGLYGTPANAIFVAYFPTVKRFTYASIVRALSHMIVYIFTSCGFIYLLEKLGNIGAWIVMLPITIGFMFGIMHFDKLEKLVIINK